jgi:hypothetical protein
MPIHVLSLLLSMATPLQADAQPNPHALCDAHADALLGALDQAHYDTATADFDAALRARYSAAKLRQDYEGLPASYGKALGRGRPHTADISGHAVVMTPLIFERGTLTAEIRCDADGAVSGLRLTPTQVMSKP